jgi:hypothetical protein
MGYIFFLWWSLLNKYISLTTLLSTLFKDPILSNDRFNVYLFVIVYKWDINRPYINVLVFINDTLLCEIIILF